jgi:hypothetical protein
LKKIKIFLHPLFFVETAGNEKEIHVDVYPIVFKREI